MSYLFKKMVKVIDLNAIAIKDWAFKFYRETQHIRAMLRPERAVAMLSAPLGELKGLPKAAKETTGSGYESLDAESGHDHW